MSAPEKLGKYELRGTLGRGAMGIVYDGWDPLIDRRVAIKTVRLVDADDEETAEALARFKREAQAAGRLTHPNIVGVYDYGEVNDIAFIVMEFASGKSLKTLLDEQKRLPPRDAVRIMEQVLAGLAYSHARGVVHRDIKPGNIIIVEGGQVKIADFGIARIESSSMTSVGTVMGTPAYMPPEQFLGEPVDARSDLYAAGVMTFQLLSGQRPYEGSMTTIMQKVLNTETPPPVSARGDVPSAFDAVVARAMARAPADRFATADEFASALRAALAQSARTPAAALPDEDDDATVVVSAKRPPAAAAAPLAPKPAATPAREAPRTVAPAAKRGGPMPLVLAGVAVLAVAGAGGAFMFLRGGSPPKPASTTPTPAPASANPTPAPTTSAPTPPVAKPSPPPPDPAIVAPAVASAAAAASCTLLTTSVSADGVQVGGFAGRGEAETAALSSVAAASSGLAVAWHAGTLDSKWCDLLDVLRPAATAGTIQLALSGGKTVLHDRDPIWPDVTAPAFPNWLVVTYLTRDDRSAPGHDLFAVQLFPNLKARGHAYAPGEVVPIRSTDTIGPPFGTDLIVAVASSGALFTKVQAPQTFATYLSSLRAALNGAAQRNEKVAVGIMTVETQEGK
ncbi:MAG: protein kinase [Rhodospirillales bacterium]